MPRDSYPPLGEWQQAVSEAILLNETQIAEAPERVRECTGRLYIVVFAGQQYAICQNPDPSNDLVAIYGESFTLTFTNWIDLNTRSAAAALASTQLPHALLDDVYWKCNGTSPYTDHHNVTGPISDWLNRAGARSADRSLPLVSSTNTERQAKPTCYFLHGADVWETEPPTTTYPDYWGNIETFTPQCGAHIFIREETTFRGWDNPELQQSYCDLISLGQANRSSISNVLVFTHSMANLILAGAINNSYCDLDLETSRWYAIQGPIIGTEAAADLDRLCAQEDLRIRELLIAFRYCDATTLEPTGTYRSMVPGYPGLDALPAVMSSRVFANMCGISAAGLLTVYSVPFVILNDLFKFGEPSDAFVPWSSCIAASDTQDYGLLFTSAFYSPEVNHLDGTCRNGNGFWGVDRQPCSWYGDWH
jgi:hypothetical protein